ncbi:MAG: MbcA/ParS/Xre antitoxin family protein [Gammaproteobacteria bacterium]|nr:MbcA/ParS/Xre antitoxin family protein [Gammaproteobacteria bacterium]
MITRLFDRWDLDSREQAALLGLSSGTRSTVSRYRKGTPLPLHQDLLDRVGHLLGIHLALRLIFPQNRQLAYRWVKTPNRRFDGKTPLEVMLGEGFLGVVIVRRYLDFERGR